MATGLRVLFSCLQGCHCDSRKVCNFFQPDEMLRVWTEEFLSTITRLDPKFIALHCQEVGGKNYEKSMQHVENFVQLLITSDELRLFDRVRVYLDEDYSSAENFTVRKQPHSFNN